MTVYPNAKINIGLNIIRKREDGYHDICTVMYPIPLRDRLEIERSDKLTFETGGIQLADDGRENLVVRAWRIVNERHNIGNVRIRLTKNIPSGAGLGGGSADAAFTIKALNDIYSLNMSNAEMERMCARLGADCAFFVRNRPAICSGIGDEMRDSQVDLGGLQLVLVKPDVSVSTAEAYCNCHPGQWATGLDKLIEEPTFRWKESIKNDFERQVFVKHPELRELKKWFYETGALYSAMSGSGSTVFGIYDKGQDISQLERPGIYKMQL